MHGFWRSPTKTFGTPSTGAWHITFIISPWPRTCSARDADPSSTSGRGSAWHPRPRLLRREGRPRGTDPRHGPGISPKDPRQRHRFGFIRHRRSAGQSGPDARVAGRNARAPLIGWVTSDLGQRGLSVHARLLHDNATFHVDGGIDFEQFAAANTRLLTCTGTSTRHDGASPTVGRMRVSAQSHCVSAGNVGRHSLQAFPPEGHTGVHRVVVEGEPRVEINTHVLTRCWIPLTQGVSRRPAGWSTRSTGCATRPRTHRGRGHPALGDDARTDVERAVN